MSIETLVECTETEVESWANGVVTKRLKKLMPFVKVIVCDDLEKRKGLCSPAWAGTSFVATNEELGNLYLLEEACIAPALDCVLNGLQLSDGQILAISCRYLLWRKQISIVGEVHKSSFVVKRYGPDFQSSGGALTLDPDCIGYNDSGWEVKGEIIEDYYFWVNEFVATHPVYGTVSGDFHGEVRAASQEAFDHFWQHHQPNAWDYGDI